MAMETLRAYLATLNPDEQALYAERAGTTIGYLRKAMSKGQRFDGALARRLDEESGARVSRHTLRPDIFGAPESHEPKAGQAPAVDGVVASSPAPLPAASKGARSRKEVTPDDGQEHEFLLFEAARLLPGIIREHLQGTDGFSARTKAYIDEEGLPARLEEAIAKGLIPDRRRQKEWRNALAAPPGLSLPDATVTFGRSLFSTKRDAYGRSEVRQRIGMVDLAVQWLQPSEDQFHLSGNSFSDTKLRTVRDAFRVGSHKRELLATAFPSSLPLGKLLARVEDLHEQIRTDAKSRLGIAPTFLAITARPEIFLALSTNCDALLIVPDGGMVELGRAAELRRW